jgi:hypothetical protein
MDDTREAALPAALPNLSPRSTRASQLKVALIFVKVAVTQFF